MKRSLHSLSNYRLTSFGQGSLVPVGLTEVLPGDTIQQATSALIRVSPLLAPVMHPVVVRIHHWFVPHRIVWDEWEPFITGGPDGMNASVFPTIDAGGSGFAVGSLGNHLGCPASVAGLDVSALPFRGYAMILNNFYRDQDLVPEIAMSTASGVDSTTNVDLQVCAWEKDYFTTSRPWTQKGPEVTIPLGTSAPVVSDGTQPNMTGGGGSDIGLKTGNDAGGSQGFVGRSGTWGSVGQDLIWGNNTGLETDLTNASAADINQLRLAFALQRYEEARARYGSRYTEYLRYLGVRSSDARLQLPEYLGGGKQTLQFSEVLQTGVTTDGDDAEGVGNLKGHGIGAMRSNRYRRFFEEHGYVFTLMSVRPKTIYAQGLPRTWNRRTKEDFFQKELQHIGQQEVLNKELKASHASPDGVFGWQDRYDEYRRQESSVSGEFATTALDYWHMARIFASDPALNADFVKCVPTQRIYASTATDPLYVMANHSIQARRLVDASGTSYIY